MVAKASAGAIEHVPVARVNNLSRTLIELKEQGFWYTVLTLKAKRLTTRYKVLQLS